MAEKHGKNQGQLINLVSTNLYTKNTTINVDIDTADITAAGDDSKQYLEGQNGWTMDSDYNWEGSSGQIDATIFKMITSGSAKVQSIPGGTTTSTQNPMYRGDAILKSYSISIPHDGAITCKASYQGTGALNRYTSGQYLT